MLIRSKPIPSEAEITDAAVFHNRRKLIKSMMALGLGHALPTLADSVPTGHAESSLLPTPLELVKNYTNYYEFAYNKTDASQAAQLLATHPWRIEIDGEVEKPLVLDIDQLLQRFSLQQRIYRFRCVEGWAMVVPWQGFPLADLLKLAQPLSSAKFVKFSALQFPEVMSKQQSNAILTWPYVEGLRIDEATHPLTILATGMYDQSLPKQNGAPLRLVVPWKYGFKSIKAIVRIELTHRPPETSWHLAAPNEYGFYANVNPQVPHPRWSQSSERLLGSNWFSPRRKTELFNGYGDQVAGLYSDMDLRHFF